MKTVRDLLDHIRFSDLEIKSLMALRDRLGARALAINSSLSERVSGSKNLDGMYSIVDDYVELEKVIDEKLKILTDAKKIALNNINRLNNPLQRVILIERYFNGESWKSISIIIGRSEKWAKQTHDKAIKLCEING